MNSRQIECILEVAKTLNFNRAAENLFISQPTLSHHIQVAETELGFKIFTRDHKKVSLTNVGQTFCEGLKVITSDFNALVEQCQNFGEHYQKTIKINIFERLALLKLPEAIVQYNQKYPNIFIDPIFDNSAKRFETFLNGTDDILLIRDEEAKVGSELVTYPLYDSKIKLVVSSDDPLAQKKKVTLADLHSKTLLVGGKSSKSLRNLQKELVKKYQLKTLNSRDHNTTLTQVQAKKAVCLSPDFYEDPFQPGVTWLDIEPTINIPCYLATKKDASKEVIAFVKLLQQLYR